MTVIVQTHVECWSELTATKYIPGQTQMPRGIWRSQEEKPGETGRSEKKPGGAIEPIWVILGQGPPTISHLVAILCLPLGYLGASLEPSWGILEQSWSQPGPAWSHLAAILGPSWSHLGTILGRLGAILGHLGPSWGILEPSLAP